MRFGDFTGLRKKSIIQVLNKENSFGEIFVFTFSIPDGLTWRPGEHGIFRLKGIEGMKWRAFSLVSIQEEGVIQIATQIAENPSPFKARLRELEPGDSLQMRGPFGWFTIQDEDSPILFIANGIGITPVRALLESLKEDGAREVHAIYAAKERHLFQEDLEAVCEENPKISISFVHGRDAVATEIMVHAKKYGNNAYYYLSGSFQANKSNQALLKWQGIRGFRIIQDPFFGYEKR